MHDTEIPGAPTRILMLEEGDEPAVPHEVDTRLRGPWRDETPWQSRERRDRVLENFRSEYEALDRDGRRACLADYRLINPDLSADLQGVIHDILMAEPPVPRGTTPHEPPPPTEGDDAPAMGPIYTALALCVCVQVLVQVLLVALRVGGALDWSWGWTLAPLWVPSTMATVLVVVIGLALAALDERDAARRRRWA